MEGPHTQRFQQEIPQPRQPESSTYTRLLGKARQALAYLSALTSKFNALSPETKHTLVWSVGGTLVLVVFFGTAYNILSGGAQLGSTGSEGDQLAAVGVARGFNRANTSNSRVINNTSDTSTSGNFDSLGTIQERLNTINANRTNNTAANTRTGGSGRGFGQGQGGSFGSFGFGSGSNFNFGSSNGSQNFRDFLNNIFGNNNNSSSNTNTTNTTTTDTTTTDTTTATTTPVVVPEPTVPTIPNPSSPLIAALSNTPSTLTSETVTSVVVSGTDITQYRYRLNAGSFVGPYSISQPISVNVTDGTHTLHVVGGDSTGNFQAEGDATSLVWAVDTTPPRAQINGISGNVVSAENTTLSIGGSDVTHYRYRLNNGNFEQERSVSEAITLFSLPEGTHTIEVIGRDAVGNYQSTANPSFLTWAVDRNAPEVSGFSITTGNDDATFTWSTSEATEGTLELGLKDVNFSHTETHGDVVSTTDHSLTARGLQRCATFGYRITSRDKGDFTAVQEGTLTTKGCTGSADVVAQTDSFIAHNVGGSLHLLDLEGKGIELTVPAFFAGTGRDAQFQIKQLEEQPYVNALPGPTGVSRVGNYIYRLSALEDISTLISAFDEDLTVRMHYDPGDLQGIPEDTLSIRRHDGTQWHELSNCSINTTAHYVTCTTDHFSDFELFGVAPGTLTGISDTLSDSDLSVTSSHTIRYTSSTTVTAGEVIALAFDDVDDRFDGWESLGTSDVTFTGATLVTTCGAGTDEVTMAVRTDTENEGMRFTVCPGDTVGSGSKVITIASGIITNPNVAGSYGIKIRSGSDDNADEFAKTRVAIIDDVVVTAAVQPSFTFIISGVTTGASNANDTGTTDITTTATNIPWGNLVVGTPKTARQDIGVSTNAFNGFSVTLYQDQNLTSASGADIDSFKDGADPAVPEVWAAPSSNVSDENTFGHFGVTTDDDTLSSGDTFGSALYDAIGTILAPVEVFYHDGPADGTTQNKGAASVGYKIEIGPLQESGDDYGSTLTYIATPTF